MSKYNENPPADDPDELNVVHAAPMRLLPPAPGLCPVCAVKHEADDPHNRDSLFYQMRFHGTHGRWPGWADAIAHCSEPMRTAWIAGLDAKHAWSAEDAAANANGTAIAEPCEGNT